MKNPVLITGGAGFVGSNLADSLLRDGRRVVVADTLARPGVEKNAEWLSRRHGDRVSIERLDVASEGVMAPLAREASEIYHLAAQVAVTTSVEDPADDLRTNILGTFQILEAARARPTPPPLLFTSTNKVYGGLDHLPVEPSPDGYRFADSRTGVGEDAPLDFHSPYGCSKGAADQYVRDYARIYGLPTIVFRMSCIYGPRQWGTEDQGWVAHFARALLAGDPIRIFGDGDQVRDVLWIGDLVAAMRTAVERIDVTAGQVYNVGGGPENAVSIRRAVDALGSLAGRTPPVAMEDWRPGDQRVFVTDTRRLQEAVGWKPATGWEEGFGRLVEWLRKEAARPDSAPAQSLAR